MWAALRLNRQGLHFATAMLNKLGSPREAWMKQATILEIKSAYIERRAADLAALSDCYKVGAAVQLCISCTGAVPGSTWYSSTAVYNTEVRTHTREEHSNFPTRLPGGLDTENQTLRVLFLGSKPGYFSTP